MNSNSALTSTASVDLSSPITELVLANDLLQLFSGEVQSLAVWGVDEQGAKRQDIISSLDCVLLDGNDGVVKVFSSCQIAGLSPGKSRLQAQYNASSGLVLSDIVEVEVVPRQLTPVDGAVSIEMNDWQEALWLSFSQLSSGGFYRAILQSIGTRLPARAVLEVIPRFSDINSACRNTLPVDADRVACYFYSQDNAVTIVIQNAAREQFQARLVVESAQEQEQFAVSYAALTAKPIFPNSVETHTVFANEVGQNSANYFRLMQNTQPARPLKVTLFNYTHQVWLAVSWGKKVCTKEMMTISPSQISCTIPTDDAGNVLIKVDGNNQIELINAPAAVDGSSKYSLLVEYL